MVAALKPVLKRPWLHHLIIISYIAAPFVNILLLVVFLLTAPIVGILLYFVNKFSWYIFPGLGIRFIRLPPAKKRDIRRMLKNRFALRQRVDIPCTWVSGDEQSDSKIVDLSSGACYIHVQFARLVEGLEGELKVLFPFNKRLYSLPRPGGLDQSYRCA